MLGRLRIGCTPAADTWVGTAAAVAVADTYVETATAGLVEAMERSVAVVDPARPQRL